MTEIAKKRPVQINRRAARVNLYQQMRNQKGRMADAKPDCLWAIEEEEEDDVQDPLQASSNNHCEVHVFPSPLSGDSPTKVSDIDKFFPQHPFDFSLYDSSGQNDDDHSVDQVTDEFAPPSCGKASDKHNPTELTFSMKAVHSRRRHRAKQLSKGQSETSSGDGVEEEDVRKDLFGGAELHDDIQPDSAGAATPVAFSEVIAIPCNHTLARNPKEANAAPQDEGIIHGNEKQDNSTVPSDPILIRDSNGRFRIESLAKVRSRNVASTQPVDDIDRQEKKCVNAITQADKVDFPFSDMNEDETSKKGVLIHTPAISGSRAETKKMSRIQVKLKERIWDRIHRSSLLTNYRLESLSDGADTETQPIVGSRDRSDSETFKNRLAKVNSAPNIPSIGTPKATQSLKCPDIDVAGSWQNQYEIIPNALEKVSQSTVLNTHSVGSQMALKSPSCPEINAAGSSKQQGTTIPDISEIGSQLIATDITPSQNSPDFNATGNSQQQDAIIPDILDKVSHSTDTDTALIGSHQATVLTSFGSRMAEQTLSCPDINAAGTSQQEDATNSDISEKVPESTNTNIPSTGYLEASQSHCPDLSVAATLHQQDNITPDISEKVSQWKRFRNKCQKAFGGSHLRATSTPSIVCSKDGNVASTPLPATYTSFNPGTQSLMDKKDIINSASDEDDDDKDADVVNDDDRSEGQEASMDDLSEASTPKRKQNQSLNQNPNESLQFLLEGESTSTLTLYVDHYGSVTFRILMEDLVNNENVTELKIFRCWDESVEQKRDTAEIRHLFRAIRSLPRLESLQLANFHNSELDGLAVRDWRNQRLKELQIHVCSGAISQRMLRILSEMPALKVLVLEVNETFPLHIVLASTTLESLTVVANNYKMDNLNLMEAFHKLRKNTSLKQLVLEPPMVMRSFKFLAYSLRENIQLEELKVHVLPGDDHESSGAANELARTLQVNSSLKKLWNLNYANVGLTKKSCTSLLTALAGNTVFEDFLFFNEEPAFHFQKQRFLNRNKVDQIPLMPDIFGCRTLATATGSSKKDDGLLDSLVQDYASIGENLFAVGKSINAKGSSIAIGMFEFMDMAFSTCT